MDMKNTTKFKSSVSITTYIVYGSIFTIFMTFTIFSAILDLPQLLTILIFISGLPFLLIMLSPLNITYSLTNEFFSARWLFKKIIINYSEILYVRSYELPKDTYRVFGIPLILGERNNQEAGDFYIIYAGQPKGIMIELDNERIFGSQLFITPKDINEFREKLQHISKLTIDYVVA